MRQVPIVGRFSYEIEKFLACNELLLFFSHVAFYSLDRYFRDLCSVSVYLFKIVDKQVCIQKSHRGDLRFLVCLPAKAPEPLEIQGAIEGFVG